MTQRETGNNAYAKFWREKQRILANYYILLLSLKKNIEAVTFTVLDDTIHSDQSGFRFV